MKVKLLIFLLLILNIASAGTPGNDDVSILYGSAMLLLVAMVTYDYIIKYIKNKKAKALIENDVNDSDV